MKIVILAGGGGTRLFPLSRRDYPKQFLSIDSDMSLLTLTMDRFLSIVDPEDIVIVTNDKYYFFVKEELEKIKAEKGHIVTEPYPRNTAPAIALTISYLKDKLKCSDDEVIMAVPADHIIEPKNKFEEAVKICLKASEEGKIVTLGVKPDKPDTGYGYIRCGKKNKYGYEAEKFIEKPNIENATKFFEEGNYLWNAGLYSFTIGTFMSELEKYEPDLFEYFNDRTYEKARSEFKGIKKISIDYAISERSDKIIAVPLEVDWNDVGSWDSLYDYMDKDNNGNVLIGDCESIDCKNSFVLSTDRLITGIGLDNTIVVETDDVILVSKRGETQKVKEIVEIISKRVEAKERSTAYRPWGTYKVISEGRGFKVRIITVNPGESLDMQRHRHRSEHWVVITGVAKVILGDDEWIISKNRSVYVPKGVKHKLINIGNEILEIIEVQNGDYIGSDDVEAD